MRKIEGRTNPNLPEEMYVCISKSACMSVCQYKLHKILQNVSDAYQVDGHKEV